MTTRDAIFLLQEIRQTEQLVNQQLRECEQAIANPIQPQHIFQQQLYFTVKEFDSVIGDLASRVDKRFGAEQAKPLPGYSTLRAGSEPGPGPRSPLVWDHVEASSFPVRIGPNYSKFGNKNASKDELYELVAMDQLYKEDDRIEHIAEQVDISKLDDAITSEFSQNELDSAGLPRILICNAQIPNKAAALFSGGKKDGNDAGTSLVFYYVIKPSTLRVALADVRGDTLNEDDPDDVSLRRSIRLYRRFAQNWDTDDELRRRFKAIGFVNNIQDLKVTGVSMVERYNGKPAIVFKAGQLYNSEDRTHYLEMDIKIQNFSYVARKGLDTFKSHLAGLSLRCGFVIQGESDDELPERLLGCGKFEHYELDKAVQFR